MPNDKKTKNLKVYFRINFSKLIVKNSTSAAIHIIAP